MPVEEIFSTSARLPPSSTSSWPTSSRSTSWSTRFHFRPANGGELPTFSGGAHVVVEMREAKASRRAQPYSLMSSPLDTSEYTISRAPRRCRPRRLAVHAPQGEARATAWSSPIRSTSSSLDLRAKKHLMIAGGIGITPFMAQTAQLASSGGNFELHYACRTASLFTYGDVLAERYGRRIHLYHDDRGEKIELARLLSSQPLGTHLYICGPAADDRLGAPHRRRGRLAVGDRALRAFLRAAARPALRRHARRLRQTDPRRRAAEPARSRSRRPASTRPISAAAASAASAKPTSSPATANSCTTTTG